MNRHHPARAKAAKKLFGTLEEIVGLFLKPFMDHVDPQEPHVVVGPVCWELPGGSDQRLWYFVVIAGGENLWITALQGMPTSAIAEQARGVLMVQLATGKPIVIHDFDDELAMAKFCEAAWPSGRITTVRQDIEAERLTRG